MDEPTDSITEVVDAIVDDIDVDRLDEEATRLWPVLLPHEAQDKLIAAVVTEIRARLTGYAQ